MENGSNTLLHAYLTECQRAGCDHSARNAAGQQRFRIGFFVLSAHITDDLFVAGQFDVPAQQDIGCPHQRMKPIDCQQNKPKRLPPVVTAAQMRPLMGNHVFHLYFVHTEGQIDFRANDTQNKGRVNLFIEPDVVFPAESNPDSGANPQITNYRIEQQCSHSRKPNPT